MASVGALVKCSSLPISLRSSGGEIGVLRLLVKHIYFAGSNHEALCLSR